MTAVVPPDLVWAQPIASMIGSADDAGAATVDRALDLQTAAYEAFVDVAESAEAHEIRIDVSRSSSGRLRVRIAAVEPITAGEPSFLARRVISTLAEHAEFEPSSIEFEFGR